MFAFPSPAFAVSLTPGSLFAQGFALQEDGVGWGEAGQGWQAGGPPLLGFQLFCMTKEVRTARKGQPSRAWRRPRGACDSAVPGLACLACQGGGGRGSWTGGKEQKRSPEPLCGALASECGGEGRHQWDFCVTGQEHGPEPGASCSGAFAPFLPGAAAARGGPPPARGELAWTQPIPALPFSPFQMNQPQKPDDFFLGPGPAPLPGLLTAGFQRPLSGPIELSATRAVADQGMCCCLLEATGLLLAADGNRLGRQRQAGSGIPGKRPFLHCSWDPRERPACISWGGASTSLLAVLPLVSLPSGSGPARVRNLGMPWGVQPALHCGL